MKNVEIEEFEVYSCECPHSEIVAGGLGTLSCCHPNNLDKTILLDNVMALCAKRNCPRKKEKK